MTDKAYTDAPSSFRASVDLRSRLSGGAQPSEKVVSLPPSTAEEDSQPSSGGRMEGAPSVDLPSAFELIAEASEAIRISQARADELEQELSRFREQSSDEVLRLTAEIAAVEERLAASEARADEAESWLVRLHDAVQSAFSPLQRRPKVEQIADRSRGARSD